MTDQPDPHNLGLMLGRMDAKLDGLRSALEASQGLHKNHDERLKRLETKNLLDRAVFLTSVTLLASKDYIFKVLALLGAH